MQPEVQPTLEPTLQAPEVQPSTEPRRGFGGSALDNFRRVMRVEAVALLVACLALVLLFSVLSEFFFSVQNFLNIGRAVAVTLIVASGTTIALISGAFDLSREPGRVRDRYGEHLWCQQVLLARRLEEPQRGMFALPGGFAELTAEPGAVSIITNLRREKNKAFSANAGTDFPALDLFWSNQNRAATPFCPSDGNIGTSSYVRFGTPPNGR